MLGFGAIGQAIGQLLKAAGFQITGFKRRPAEEESDTLLKSCANRILNDLEDVLRTSDFIVSILLSTSATKYLLTEEKIAVCADKKPVFTNVGRGDVISEQTLLRALDRGYFSKIVLDIFEKEPLPQDSALWTHPGVHLTPHISARCFIDDVADVFFDNLNLFLADKPMNYVMDWVSGY
uniref:D-isomer specific 2-hydroxyacid dehydrogenase NAD-binding domain-containing protein n=1 Tax=Globisporangium ultimum (strain ATCC 200006 / CBS 805.95 / DAOM BR144) TaxID=431595 RepID=K3WWW0_GLOUD